MDRLLHFRRALSIVALLCSCSETPTAPVLADPDLTLRTDSAAYYLNSILGRVVTFKVTNASADTVLLARCRGSLMVGLERVTDEGWTSAWLCCSGSVACEGALDSLALAPGAAAEAQVRLQVVGVFRIRAPLYYGAHTRYSRRATDPFVVY
jgi:hypothetical protein